MKRLGLAFLTIGVAAISPAQLLNESWRAYGDNGASSYSRPAFIKENRTVFIDQYSFFFRLVCVDAYGVEVWSVPLAKTPTSVRATTDNFIYVTTAGPNPSVLAFSQDGVLQWEHVHSSINMNTGLQDTRIIGNDLVAAGVGRTVPISTGERSILICLDRMTGAVKYKREYLINGIPFFGRQMIRSSGGAGFLVGTKSNGTGVMKFDPANGDPLGTYISGPFQAKSAEVD